MEPEVSIIIPVKDKDKDENVEILAKEIDASLSQVAFSWECVWVDDGSTDTTATRLIRLHERSPRHRWAKGFCYLVAVMDWASRKVLSWRLSNTLDPFFCTEALEEALNHFGTPEIFNTDQGSHFTSEAFTGILNARGIRISMDGKGTYR